MKKRRFSMCLAAVCVLSLLCGAVPAVGADKAPGGDFAWTDSDEPMLIEQILQRDGLIDGIWFPWFDGANVGHSLTGNELMVRYYGSSWSRPALDTVGADKIYREIYNLKTMGYNLLGYGGSIYDEGVIHDEYGDVLGVKQEFLDNARRLLDMCREIGMPVMWTIYFHSSSAPDYYGMDAYNIMAQKYVNPTIADHYAERFARPVCEMLSEYPDVVAVVAVADEPENEISDSEEGNHFGTSRDFFGVNEDDLVYFMSRINAVCKEELPHVARTVASCDKNKAMYGGFDLDLMGHNHYDNNANLPDADTYFSDCPMIMTEYNVGHDGKFTPEEFAQRLIRYRQQMIEKGYKGGVQWAWMSYGMHRSTAYYLLDGYSNGGPNTNFVPAVADLRHYMDDYRAEYRGETVVLDKPVLYCNEGGGYVEWIPSRQATKMDLLRSTDGGKTWTTILKDVYQSQYVSKGKGRYKDTATAGSMYKIVVRDNAGNTAESAPNNVAGVESKFIKSPTTVKLDGPTDIDNYYGVTGSYSLYSFSVAQNRPYKEEYNLIQNGSFESTANAAWNGSSFLGSGVSVVTDSTAPEGNKSLYFNSSGNSTERWYTFTVPVEPNTDYVFSAWVKGSYLSASNSGRASVGVVDPSTGKFMVCSKYAGRASRNYYQIYPTAWDGEWHLRSVAFNSADLTRVTIALCGKNSKLWVDGLALYQNGQGVKYVGERNGNRLKVDMDADRLICEDTACVTKNSGFSSGNTYWKDGAGWRNGFLSIATDDEAHGKVLHYTAGDAAGIYYVKWVDVKPHTEYAFAFDAKILQSGYGKLMVIDDAMSIPQVTLGFEFDKGIYGSAWGSYYIQFNTSAFTRIGIAVCDLGGEALIDNLRLFKTADGSKNTADGTVATLAPQATTTTTKEPPRPSSSTRPVVGDGTTTVINGDTTTSTGGSSGDSMASALPTDATVTEQGAASDGGKPTTTKKTVGKEEDQSVLLSALSFKDNHVVLGVILYVTAAAVLATIALLIVVLLRKKKQTPPSES